MDPYTMGADDARNGRLNVSQFKFNTPERTSYLAGFDSVRKGQRLEGRRNGAFWDSMITGNLGHRAAESLRSPAGGTYRGMRNGD
jgi:hypothetical protein